MDCGLDFATHEERSYEWGCGDRDMCSLVKPSIYHVVNDSLDSGKFVGGNRVSLPLQTQGKHS
ncbi:hypothetical protein HS1genome_1426 [Sulfodiicoccus acidiphilus]|uniref:Uncharacterized protein n=1 Tax=Sulfodiicoccus acidiphilus TaxID=1670455 RepID=A0A348B4D5_9CREN|nr:hypothetical protein HS1genome_1426 [Sulfodiicoccus acidiphilus]GGU05644.1 hypothetical protein GCM10007116_22510 [Sulfodiicoccus acidiphilus]